MTGNQIIRLNVSDKRIHPWHEGIESKVIITRPEARWRLVEEFGPGCFTEQEDGRLLFQIDYTDEKSQLGWLLAFGTKVEVLEPETIKEKLPRTAESMISMYRRERKKNTKNFIFWAGKPSS